MKLLTLLAVPFLFLAIFAANSKRTAGHPFLVRFYLNEDRKVLFWPETSPFDRPSPGKEHLAWPQPSVAKKNLASKRRRRLLKEAKRNARILLRKQVRRLLRTKKKPESAPFMKSIRHVVRKSNKLLRTLY